MGKKSLADLPPDAIVEFRRHNATMFEFLAINQEGDAYFLPKNDRQLMGIKLEVVRNPANGKPLLRVTNSEATHGYGPLAYDLAMEFASTDPWDGLITGTGLTEDSRGVWKFYVERRDDVERVEMPEDHPLRKSGRLDREFPFIWRKKKACLAELESSGKLKCVEGVADLMPAESECEPDPQLDELLKKIKEGDPQ